MTSPLAQCGWHNLFAGYQTAHIIIPFYLYVLSEKIYFILKSSMIVNHTVGFEKIFKSKIIWSCFMETHTTPVCGSVKQMNTGDKRLDYVFI